MVVVTRDAQVLACRPDDISGLRHSQDLVDILEGLGNGTRVAVASPGSSNVYVRGAHGGRENQNNGAKRDFPHQHDLSFSKYWLHGIEKSADFNDFFKNPLITAPGIFRDVMKYAGWH